MSQQHPPAPSGAPERPDALPPAAAPSPRGPESADRWHPWTGPAALAVALLFVTIAGIFVGGIAVSAGAEFDSPGVSITLTAIQGLCFIGAALFFAKLVAVPRPSDFGLRRPRTWWVAALLVPGVWLGFILCSALWVTIIGESPDEDLPDELGADDSDVALVAVMVLVCVLAPVGEEFLFRGYIFRALRNWKGLWPAAIISGIVFGAIHLLSADAVALVPLAILGIGMALVYHYTDSLYTAMALHALNNAIAFGVSQDWDWQIPLVIVGGIGATLLLGVVVQRGIAAWHGGAGRARA